MQNPGFGKFLWPRNVSILPHLFPVGRCCFNRLPFGICSEPDHFLQKMLLIFYGFAGIFCNMDDVIMFGETQQQQRDEHLLEFLRKPAQADVM